MDKDKNGTDPEKIAVGLLNLMTALSGVMDSEVEVLRRQDYACLNGLRQEKAKLVRDYQLSMGVLSEHPELLKGTSPETKETLRQEGLRLKIASSRNAEGLNAAITATQSLIHTVIDAARGQIMKQEGYEDPRKNPLMLGSYSPMCSPVAVDRTA